MMTVTDSSLFFSAPTDRVVLLLLDNKSFSQSIHCNNISANRISAIPAATTALSGGTKGTPLRYRTASLPSLHSTILQKSLTSSAQHNSLTEKEKLALRRNIWQERVQHDIHFPVKDFASGRQSPSQPHLLSSLLVKRPRRMSSSATCGRSRHFSEDINGREYSNVMDDSPMILISCISAVLCSYLIDVTDLSYDPNEIAAHHGATNTPILSHNSSSSLSPFPSPLPSPLSKRSTSPASPSIFNTADPRNYPALFAFVPQSFRNCMFNQPEAKVDTVKHGFSLFKPTSSAAGLDSEAKKYSDVEVSASCMHVM
jgi:hypothetical protein